MTRHSDIIAVGKRTRPRGFVPWNPRPTAKALIGDVQAVLRQYANQLPLTCRQIFYRLVATVGFAKTERSYAQLCDALSRARRAQLIQMASIRDDGREWDEPWGFVDAADLRRYVSNTLDRAQLDPSSGQAVRQLVICEARGMGPMLAKVAHPFGAAVMGSGGFSSLTSTFDTAEISAREGRPVVVHHFGDHDPSGVHLFQSMAEDVEAFVSCLGGDIAFRRIAVTPDQVARYQLLTSPPKKTDRRSFDGETVQAEALPPDVLQQLLRRALEANFDREIYNAHLAVFEGKRSEMAGRWCEGTGGRS